MKNIYIILGFIAMILTTLIITAMVLFLQSRSGHELVSCISSGGSYEKTAGCGGLVTTCSAMYNESKKQDSIFDKIDNVACLASYGSNSHYVCHCPQNQCWDPNESNCVDYESYAKTR